MQFPMIVGTNIADGENWLCFMKTTYCQIDFIEEFIYVCIY